MSESVNEAIVGFPNRGVIRVRVCDIAKDVERYLNSKILSPGVKVIVHSVSVAHSDLDSCDELSIELSKTILP